MPILSINVRPELDMLIMGVPSGKDTSFDLQVMSGGRLSDLVRSASALSRIHDRVSIEVKFNSKYSSRVKRLEIVGVTGIVVTIYKMSALKRYDKDAIELNRDIEELAPLYPHSIFFGKLVMSNQDNIARINSSISELSSMVEAIAL